MVSNMFLSAESNTTTWIFVALLVVLVVVLLVVPMFTNKKRAKQTTELHNSLRPGDVIKTVGGIIGTIKEVREVSPSDKEMVIETGDGDNKTTMVFDIQALYQIVSRAAEPIAPVAEPAAAPASDVENTDVATTEPEQKPDETLVAEEKTEAVAAEPAAETVDAEEEVKTEPVAEPAVAETEQAAVAETEAKVEPAPKKPRTTSAAKTSAPKKKPINSKNSTKK